METGSVRFNGLSELSRDALAGAIAAALGLLAWLLYGQDTNQTVFLALNLRLADVPGADVLWSSLSVLGLGLSAFLLLAMLAETADQTAQQPLAALLWCFPIGGILTHLLKHLFGALRPAAVLAPEQFHLIGDKLLRGSMPSGHSVTAVAVLAIVLTCWQLPRSAVLGMIALAVAVVLSRIATAAHWPSDVCAGAGLGLLTGRMALRLARPGRLVRWLDSRPGQLVLGLSQVVGGVIMVRIDTGYPLAQWLQWLLGGVGLFGGALRMGCLLPTGGRVNRLAWRLAGKLGMRAPAHAGTIPTDRVAHDRAVEVA